jgi:hypothetical protein
MTFLEIFENFKNHEYIQRKCWHKDVFIQYRDSIDLIRMVQFVENSQAYADEPFVIDNDIRLSASDLFANDWIAKEKQRKNTFWDYVGTLDKSSNEWRIAMEIGQEYHDSGKNPDEYVNEIQTKVNKLYKK